MSANDLIKVYKHVGRLLVRNSPTVLTAIGVGGLVTTVIFAVGGTIKALEIVEHERLFLEEEEHGRPLEPMDIVQLTWKCYIPTALMGITTIGCMIGANHVNLRRNAALTSLYSLADATLKEYQEKVVKTIGEKKAEELREEIIQENLDRNPPNEKSVIITGHGDYLCYDYFSKRYFRSNIEAIRKAENAFNRQLNLEGWLNINYLYELLGLEPIELGDEYGWIAERGLLEFKYSTRMAADSEEPTLVVDYRVSPYHI